MADKPSKYLGKKYACPGCHSQLKFRRAPKQLLQTCPNCRRKIRLRDRESAANQDELLREAIDSLVQWNEPEDVPYDYRRDPKLDRAKETEPGIWNFDQPWPEEAGDVVHEDAEVLFNPEDTYGTVLARKALFEGEFRRVTAVRTGQVEEMQIVGHWWGAVQPHEAKIGLLKRVVVRGLNRIVTAKNFIARINRVQRKIIEQKKHLEYFVDLAIDTRKPDSKSSSRRR